MSELLNQIEQAFVKHGNLEDAKQMKAYLKGQFEFYGIKQGPRRVILKEVFRNAQMPEYDSVSELIREMYTRDEREWHYSAIDLMLKYKKFWQKEDIELIEWMCLNNSWWDTVDGISVWIAGPFLKRYPTLVPTRTDEWIEDDSFWMQRMAIIFQLKFKEELNFELLSKYILRRIDSNEFFIRKAIGWVLREYSKTAPDLVRAFVNANPNLSKLSKKEALRLIEKKA